MGIVPTFPNDNEKDLSVVRLQVAKAYWAYTPCTMPHTSEAYIKSQFSPTATTTPAMSVPMVPTEHPKPNTLTRA